MELQCTSTRRSRLSRSLITESASKVGVAAAEEEEGEEVEDVEEEALHDSRAS
jgi:hypothetical protein